VARREGGELGAVALDVVENLSAAAGSFPAQLGDSLADVAFPLGERSRELFGEGSPGAHRARLYRAPRVIMVGAMDDPEARPEPGSGRMRSSFGEVAAAFSELCALRLEMARVEARSWGRSAAWRLAMFAAAGILAVLALVTGSGLLVALVHAWTGSWVAAFAIVVGLELAAGAGLAAIAWRAGRARAPLLSRTARELRRDLEDLTAGSR